MKRFVVVLAALASTVVCHGEEVRLSSLNLNQTTQGHYKPVIDKSVTGQPLSIGGTGFEHGVGGHAASHFFVQLDGKAERFEAMVGVDDDVKKPYSTVEFHVYLDGRKVYESGVMRSGMKPKKVNVSLTGAKLLLLKISDAGDGHQYDHADWADAKIVTSGTRPYTIAAPPDPKVILTPPAGPEPRLNSAAVYGCRPSHPFLYRVPATGDRPMKFSAENLPDSLRLNEQSGIITGEAPAKGDYKLVVAASNDRGRTTRTLTIKSGDTLALTPYMGWNDWYAFYENISDEKIRAAADALVGSGMADYGYSYISIDDCWMRKASSDNPALSGNPRDEKGFIIPNKHFPDMNGLTDYLHKKGLKAGIYTSPGPLTCQSYAGSMDFEAQDAEQYAKWNFDLLKYDWCSYGGEVGSNPDLEQLKKPYSLMGGLLEKQDRDIIFNLCQYGRGDVWRWGVEVGGQSWRTSGDLGFALGDFMNVAKRNVAHRAWNGPGSWNDPDYLMIGYIGDRRTRKLGEVELIPSPLTPTEQYSFMSIWCLMASPLMYSGDVTQMDDFTRNILCNAEVIEVDQDPLGQCAAMAELGDDGFLLIKDMADGSKAVGLCNGGESTSTLTANWSVVGVEGKQRVRDLWRQKDMGVFDGQFEADVPRHGVKFVRLWPGL